MEEMVVDELVYTYILESYTPGLVDEVMRSFELLYAFGKKFFDKDLVELVADSDNMDNENLKDTILAIVKRQLDALLKEHSLTVEPDTDFFTRNEILSGLLLLQHLDDYNEVGFILESALDNAEKVSTVLSTVCAISHSKLLAVLTDVSEDLVIAIKAMVYDREKTAKQAPLSDKILEKMRLFNGFIANNQALGVSLVKHGIRVGEPFEVYMHYLTDHLKTVSEIPQKALDILSTLMVSSDGYNLPLISYRRYNQLFLSDLNTITKIDAVITSMLNDFNRYITEHTNGQNTVPETSNRT